jgi:hypothetical protein
MASFVRNNQDVSKISLYIQIAGTIKMIKKAYGGLSDAKYDALYAAASAQIPMGENLPAGKDISFLKGCINKSDEFKSISLK